MMARGLNGHLYRLELTANGQEHARAIEFAAHDADMALSMTHKFSGARSVAMFEDGRKLADLTYDQGFWKVR